MPEFDRPVANHDQASVLGLFEACDVESESSAHVGDETEVRTADGGDEQDCAALLVHVGQATAERVDHRARRSERHVRGAGFEGNSLRGAEFLQRQRIARRRPVEPLNLLGGHCVARGRRR